VTEAHNFFFIEETGQSELYEMSLAIEKRMKEEKGLIPNVDFFSASVYHSSVIFLLISRKYLARGSPSLYTR
jgi:hypothetical protein